MYYSLFEVFSIGIGPSSSHTVGPMKAAKRFTENLIAQNKLQQTTKVKTTLYGSLALTGVGHGTLNAVIYGLAGFEAAEIDLTLNPLETIKSTKTLCLGNQKNIPFIFDKDILLEKETFLKEHSNGLKFEAINADGKTIFEETYFSVGGGTIARQDEIKNRIARSQYNVPYPFDSCAELIELTKKHNMTIDQIVMQNEEAIRPFKEIREGMYKIHQIMQDSIDAGIHHKGELPGGLNIKRRAPQIYKRLKENFLQNDADPLMVIDWINLWAFAVSEENACGGKIVTAPTMGSSGIIPAVMRYYQRFAAPKSPFQVEIGNGIFLLTASAICSLYRTNASISGAEVGCQGEVGVACSMAAAGLTAAMGGDPKQIENAAEIAMEHNLGLTCDPIAGLVQIPCIERNAMGATKAVNAARLALRGSGEHIVSLDSVIKTMYETGKHLNSMYKETSLGGLAVNALTC
ncbi:MAG: L-serine ammonia-lyase [Alphaproteobacteria bacterium]|nr:L-serine ammonia-lyase [Alphaproteobacteria bacterium]